MIVKEINLKRKVKGEIKLVQDVFLNSTNNFLSEEYRCSIYLNGTPFYLTSFGSLIEAEEYLLHLDKYYDSPEL